MKDFITEFGNFFNKSGTMNSVVWFSVLMLACIICALAGRKEIVGVIAASAVCLFVSFSPLSLGIQAIIFAAIITAWLFASNARRLEANKAKAGAEDAAQAAEAAMAADAAEVAEEAVAEEEITEEETEKNG